MGGLKPHKKCVVRSLSTQCDMMFKNRDNLVLKRDVGSPYYEGQLKSK